MCSQADDPTQYDAPAPTRPRTYVLSAEKPPEEPRPSVALAVLGTMLEEAIRDHDDDERRHSEHKRDYLCYRWTILREARDRIAAAEAWA